MKKTLLLIVFIASTTLMFGQATKQLNFGIVGVSFDIPVATDIAISPFAGTNLNLDYLNLGVKANYYFDNLIGLPAAWDLYAGANAGFAMWIGGDNMGNGNTSGVDIGLQIGGRWFWSDKWGIYLEFGGGHHSGGTAGLGLTMKL
ncbi:MAG: hypothetical protein KAG84_05195 [Bacteroidales bacterium]|nr:hypothetical protein [Bacteroidales bacterium]